MVAQLLPLLLKFLHVLNYFIDCLRKGFLYQVKRLIVYIPLYQFKFSSHAIALRPLPVPKPVYAWLTSWRCFEKIIGYGKYWH